MNFGQSVANNTASIFQSYRKSLEISYEKLADSINISPSTLRVLCSQKIIPATKNLIKIAEVFEISIDYLLLGNKTKYIRNISLFRLAENIDKMDFSFSLKAETIISSLVETPVSKHKIKFDDLNIDLTDEFRVNLKILRDFKNISQRQLANNIEHAPSTISSYETGDNSPTAISVLKIASFFDISVDFLLTGKKILFQFRNNKFLDDLLIPADQSLTPGEILLLCKMLKKINKENIN